MDPSQSSFRVKVDLTELDATRSAVAWYFVNTTQCESIEQLKDAVFKWFKLDVPPENVALWLDECVVPDDAPVLMLSANDLIVLRDKKSKETAEEKVANKDVEISVASTEPEEKPVHDLIENEKTACNENGEQNQVENEEQNQVESERNEEIVFISSMKAEYELQMSLEHNRTEDVNIVSEDLKEEKGQNPMESDKVVEDHLKENDVEVSKEIPKSGEGGEEAKVEVEVKLTEAGQSSMAKPPSNQAQNQTGAAKKKKKKKVKRTGSNYRRDQRRLQAHLQKLNIPYEIRQPPDKLKQPAAAATSGAGNKATNLKPAASKNQPNQNNSAKKRKLNDNSGRGGSKRDGNNRFGNKNNQQNRNNMAKRRKPNGNSDRNRLSNEDNYYYDDYYDYNDRNDNYCYNSFSSLDRGEASYKGDGYDSLYPMTDNYRYRDSYLDPLSTSYDSLSYGHSSTFDSLGGNQSQYSNLGINVDLLDPSIRSPGPFNRMNFGGGGGGGGGGGRGEGNWQKTGGRFSAKNRPPSLMSLPLANTNVRQKGVANNRNNQQNKGQQQNEKKRNKKSKKRRLQQRKKNVLPVSKPIAKPLKGILKKTNLATDSAVSQSSEMSYPSSSFDNDPFYASVDYSQYPTLRRFPKVNDIIAYKMLESSGGPFADISDYKVGKVVQYDDATKEMLLEFPEPVVLCENSEKGGAEDEFIEEIAVDFGSIVEVRLITDDKWR